MAAKMATKYINAYISGHILDRTKNEGSSFTLGGRGIDWCHFQYCTITKIQDGRQNVHKIHKN